LDEKSLKIKKLLNIIGIENISYRKLSALYKERYNAIISKTNVNEILKYKLGLRFLKTGQKNKILLSNSSKEQAFFILKILIRHLKLQHSLQEIQISKY
jgi:hypothetical protein